MRSAMKVVASAFGTIIGLAGIEHGIGEILQGNRQPPGLTFESWPNAAPLRALAGEPAMSVIPSLLIAGILTVGLSLVTIVWSVFFVGRRRGGWVLMALSVLLLLAGGGIGPPVMGLIVGVAATRINRPVGKRSAPQQESGPPPLARLWPYLLVASILGYLALVPGIPLMSLYAPVADAAIVGYLSLFSFLTLILTVIAALAWDSYHRGQVRARQS